MGDECRERSVMVESGFIITRCSHRSDESSMKEKITRENYWSQLSSIVLEGIERNKKKLDD